jgi:protein TonB
MSASDIKHPYLNTQPSRLGYVAVIAVHLLAIYVLFNETAQKGLQSVIKPLSAVVIQEVIIPQAPVPSPSSASKQIKAPPQVAAKITSLPNTTNTPAPTSIPAPYIPPADTPSPAQPLSQSLASSGTPSFDAPTAQTNASKTSLTRQEMGLVCPKQIKPQMPMKAIRLGIEGVVKAQILVQNGEVKQVTILSGPQVFHTAVREAMLQYKCKAQNEAVLATQEFNFKLE